MTLARTVLLAALTCLWAGLAIAQSTLPALFDVAGVAADDVLNVRAAPDAQAPLIGTLAPDARNVEVVAANADGTWGLVNVGERSGWTSLRFLVRRPGQDGGRLPLPLSCHGTEPFWSTELTEQGTRFVLASEKELDFAAGDRRRSANRTDRWAFFSERHGAEVFGVIARARCGDGMSDRNFGLTLDLMLGDLDGWQMYSGCCTLSVD